MAIKVVKGRVDGQAEGRKSHMVIVHDNRDWIVSAPVIKLVLGDTEQRYDGSGVCAVLQEAPFPGFAIQTGDILWPRIVAQRHSAPRRLWPPSRDLSSYSSIDRVCQ